MALAFPNQGRQLNKMEEKDVSVAAVVSPSKEAKDLELALKQAFNSAIIMIAFLSGVIINSPETGGTHKGLCNAYGISALVSFIMALSLLVISLRGLSISASLVRKLIWVAYGIFPVPVFLCVLLLLNRCCWFPSRINV